MQLATEAYPNPSGIVARWQETSNAALRRAKDTDALGFITTQGLVLTTPDFIATLVVEATVHRLDLTGGSRAGPAPRGLSMTTARLDGLLGPPRPLIWDDITYILKTTGRTPLSDDDRKLLGPTTDILPLFS